MASGERSVSELLFGARLPNDLYEMELIGDHRLLAAVPVSADPELKRRVLGAIKSYVSNLSSVDYTIKRYGQRWVVAEATADELFIVGVLKAVDEKVAATIDAIIQGRPRPDGAGLAAAEAALVRIKSSFRCALILLSQAHSYEASAVIRLALEQVSWAYAIHKLIDEDELCRTSPTEAVSTLKTLLSFAGRLYGALSRTAHIDPRITGAYHRQNSEGFVEIRYQQSDESRVTLGHLLGVLGCFTAVTQHVLGDYLSHTPDASPWLGPGSSASERLEQALRALRSKHAELDWLPNTLFF